MTDPKPLAAPLVQPDEMSKIRRFVLKAVSEADEIELVGKFGIINRAQAANAEMSDLHDSADAAWIDAAIRLGIKSEVAAPLPEPRTLREKIDANIKRTGDWRGRTPEEVASHNELTDSEVASLPEIASDEKCRYCKCSRFAHPNDGPCTACNCEGWDTNKVEAGEWIQPITEGYRMSCCDCGLVHLMDFRIHEGKIQFRAFRTDERVAPCAAPPLDDYPPPIVRTLLDIAAETSWPRKQIILDAANELLTRKGE